MFKQRNINQINRAKKILLLVVIIPAMNWSFAGNLPAGRPTLRAVSQCELLTEDRQTGHEQETLNSESRTQNLKGNGICFTPNKGQVADIDGKLHTEVLYKGDGAGADIYLRKTGISYVYTNMGEVMHEVDEQVEELILAGTLTETEEQEKKQELMQKQTMKVHRVDMDFAGCNQSITTVNEDELEGYQNFYYAHCQQGISNVKQYNKVTYKNIYNNIDVSYYGNKATGIKYDIIVQAHADPTQVKLHWTGADNIHINRKGNLVIKTRINEFHESIPRVYQNINGKIVDVKTKYVLTRLSAGEAIINFSFSFYNSNYSLIIDPATRLWGTYYGGTGNEFGYGIVTDASTGDVYLAGGTTSSAGIAAGGFQNVYGGGGAYDAFLVKFNSAGVRLWATYYGGAGLDFGMSVATDASGNVYLAGWTNSATGIAAGGFQNTYSGGNDAFLVKFNSAGVRQWATYYGGAGGEECWSIATDAAMGDVYLAGNTSSAAGIASGGFQNVYGGGFDTFLVKFNSVGNRIWSTYYGGTGTDRGGSVTTDVSGNVYLAGWTTSTVGIALGGFQNTFGGGSNDAFLVKFVALSGNRLWATYYGGADFDYGSSIAIDTATGDVYLAGKTQSQTGIASGGFQNTYGGVYDAFLAKFNAAGSRLWATYYGGTAVDWGYSVATDAAGNVYLAGDTYSPNNIGFGGFQNILGGVVENDFLVKFDASGSRLCATYYGQKHEEDGNVAVDGCGSVYLVGLTTSTSGIASGGFQNTYGGGGNEAFLVKFCPCSTSALNLSSSNPACGVTCTGAAAVTGIPMLCSNYSYSWSTSPVQTSQTATGLCAGSYTVTVTNSNSCNPVQTGTVTIANGGSSFTVTTTATNASCGTLGSATANSTGGTPTYTYLWSNGQTNTTATGLAAGTYTITITDGNGCTATATSTIISTQPLIGQFAKGTANCNGCGCKEWIMVNATGGTNPYTYTWPDGYTNRYKNHLCPGTYIVNIKDKNGCSINVSLTTP